jgi:hypothetical protein
MGEGTGPLIPQTYLNIHIATPRGGMCVVLARNGAGAQLRNRNSRNSRNTTPPEQQDLSSLLELRIPLIGLFMYLSQDSR